MAEIVNSYNELGLTNKDFPYKRALTEIIGAGCKNGQRTILSNYEELIEKYSSYELNQLMQLAPTNEMKMIYGYLREQKRDACLDYEDLLNFALYILKTRKEVRDTWENVFDYIQVDEFQDVSLREVELVGILANKCNNLFVVGDDSQCVPEGSMIMTEQGEIPVEKISVGDKVLSGIGNSEVGSFAVDEVLVKDVDSYLIEVKTTNGYILKSTPEHQLYAVQDIDIPVSGATYLYHYASKIKDVNTGVYGSILNMDGSIVEVKNIDLADRFLKSLYDLDETFDKTYTFPIIDTVIIAFSPVKITENL